MIKYIYDKSQPSRFYKLDTNTGYIYKFLPKFYKSTQKGWIFNGKWNGETKNLKHLITHKEMKQIALDKVKNYDNIIRKIKD